MVNGSKRIYENRAYNYRKLDLCRALKRVWCSINYSNNNKKCELSRRNMVLRTPKAIKAIHAWI